MTKVQLSEDEVSEFKIEAEELLDVAEKTLLDIDKGANFNSGYDAVFRAFHSVKGAAGMLNWDSLQHHMHQLENHFQICKQDETLSKLKVSYFLNGIDACRKILEGNNIEFSYDLPGHKPSVEQEIAINISVDPSDAENSLTSNSNSTSPSLISTSSTSTSDNVVNMSKSSVDETLQKATEASLVFVIDDEPDIVDILSEMIESYGFKVKGFTKASEAIASIGKLKPQTIFTDMNMPEMTGSEVLKKTHEKDPDIPVIFVSAHLTKQILIDALSYGVFGAIEKPFNEEKIIKVCTRATKRYQLWSLLNRSINLVLYQFSGLEEYLDSKGMPEVKSLMVKEMQSLLDVRRQLRDERETNKQTA